MLTKLHRMDYRVNSRVLRVIAFSDAEPPVWSPDYRESDGKAGPVSRSCGGAIRSCAQIVENRGKFGSGRAGGLASLELIAEAR